ncbi:hypothetical protein HY484_03775 [Candidatus Woesearchaeota archaeon]|nr:hypothetical protein [Candidatus Woesearchaeota archaeon]
MTDIADLVKTLKEQFDAIAASKTDTESVVKDAHARLDTYLAKEQAVNVALKTVVDRFSPQFKITYAAELSGAVTAIPFLKDVVDDFENLYNGADRQRQRYQDAFGNVRDNYQNARRRIADFRTAVSMLQEECEKLEESKAELGQLVAHLNTANNELVAHNSRLEGAVNYLSTETVSLSDKVGKRDSFIDERYGVSVDETPESIFVDALKSVYRNLTDGNERAFNECARYVAKGVKGKALGTKEVVDMVKIVAGFETGKPGWFSKKEDAYAVMREMTALLGGINEHSDVERVFARLRTVKEKKWPVYLIADYVLSAPLDELVVAQT